MMNTLLKATETSFPPTNPSFRWIKLAGRPKKSTLCFGSRSDGSESSSSSSSPSEGDKRKQDLLARIAMLQAQKVRLTDFLDERSEYLTQFAEDANAKFDQIGENALKELDEASARIMDNLENRMQAFEETAETNRQEIEKNEKVVEEFEDQIERDRNEGLFFKNLREERGGRPQKLVPEATNEVEEEAGEVMGEIRKEKAAGSKTRRNIYLALMALLGITITDAVISSPEVEWRKVVALGMILTALLVQFIYELRLSSEARETRRN